MSLRVGLTGQHLFLSSVSSEKSHSEDLLFRVKVPEVEEAEI